MNIVDIIIKKRDGHELTEEEINYFISGIKDQTVADYQVSAFCMATYFSGMTANEMRHLTFAMAKSGDILDLSAVEGIKVDKHSTGGVGDSVSLVMGPILASEGICFAKMSGRSLGHTGGTIDKLESIPGFNFDLSETSFYRQLNDIKIAITSQTANIAPIDKQIYAIRDTSGSVESIPLIASSIMSKKLALGADFILLDVKMGSGAFMKTKEDARNLATSMVNIAKLAEKPCLAIITDMSQPLSNSIGNAIEVKTVIETLKGQGSLRLRNLSVFLSALTFVQCGLDNDMDSALLRANKAIDSGKAIDTFKLMVEYQGGDVSFVDDPQKFVLGKYVLDIKSKQKGYVSGISSETIAMTVMKLGAGRQNKNDSIDLKVGAFLHVTVGDKVEEGDVLATLYASDNKSLTSAKEAILLAFSISKNPIEPVKLVLEVIS